MATKIGNIRRATVTTPYNPLHSTGEKIKFAVYWPRKSPYPEWWSQLEAGVVTFDDVATDLDLLKSTLGINTVRVLIYYDHIYRESNGAKLGWTDGHGTLNQAYLDYLATFIDMAKARDLDVIVTMYQLLPALKATDDWTFLERDLSYYQLFHSWVLSMMATKTNVRFYNLMNEPDGYGVWDDIALAGRVLTFLSRLKLTGKDVAPDIQVLVNTSTHDNVFRRFPGSPPGFNSVYELTDVLALNTFLWADAGFWPGQTYRTQVDYVNYQNVLKKPVVMTECGHPANYAQQNVAGYPAIDENGNPTGGNATVTEESIVPQNGIFDRPKGVATGVAQTPENQARAVAEAAYWVGLSNWAGLGVWSGYDHANPALSYVYRDPFGVIDKNGTPLPAARVFKGALTGNYDDNNEFRISLIQGTVSGPPSRINGLGGYNTSDPTANTPGGVYVAPGGSWTSDNLIVGVPYKLRLDFVIRQDITVDEPLIIRLGAISRIIDFRWKRYDRSAWQRLDATGGDMDYGFSQMSPLVTGPNSFIIDLTGGLAPRITHNGTNLVFDDAPHGDLALLGWQVIQTSLTVINNSNTAIDLVKLTDLGTAGEPIAFVPRALPS